jgi:hypothetical protein
MAEVDLLIKLFDTLKDSSKDTQQMCQAMLTNQNNIGNYIKHLPMAELTEALKDHSKESSDEIGTCTETVETKSDDILEEIKTMSGKVKTMITVVIVAFALFSIASLLGVITYNAQRGRDKSPYVEVYDPGKAEEEHEDLKKEIINLLKEELEHHNKETRELTEDR